MAIEFSDRAKEELKRLMGLYPRKEALVLPALHLATAEFQCINEEVILYLAELLELPPARLYGVATFYTMYPKEKVGKYLIQVCTNISCSLLGAESLFEYLSQKLGIKEKETTEDGKFTLIKVECLGACGNAPVMQINDEYYENLTREKVDEILGSLK